MALVIRMRQQGNSSRQTFRIVVTNERNPRDGKYVEKLGWYNSFADNEKNCFLDVPRLQYWIGNGAKVSDRVKSLINKLAPEVTKEMTSRKVAKVEKKRVKRKATKK